jgi:hypothetical protein
MTRRIIFCPADLTATLLVAAFASGTAWASVSPAPISSVHAQVRLVAQPGNDDSGNDDSGNESQCLLPCMNVPSDPKPEMDGGDGMKKSDPGSNGGNGANSNGGNRTNSAAGCDRGFMLMTIDAMLRSVAAPGSARELKAGDVNRDDHLCVKLAADGRSMTRFVDNNRTM